MGEGGDVRGEPLLSTIKFFAYELLAIHDGSERSRQIPGDGSLQDVSRCAELKCFVDDVR
jgi:hypothetical protein